VKPRERFAGGGTRTDTRLTGALKALDPITGELKATLQLPLSELFGYARAAGNLVFDRPLRWDFSAHDAKRCKKSGASTSDRHQCAANHLLGQRQDTSPCSPARDVGQRDRQRP